MRAASNILRNTVSVALNAISKHSIEIGHISILGIYQNRKQPLYDDSRHHVCRSTTNRLYNTNTEKSVMTQQESFETGFEITLENQNSPPEADVFGDVFLGAVDSALSMLGDLGKNGFYSYLENNFGTTRKQIPEALGEFTKALDNVFGQAAGLLEKRIISALHEKVPGFRYSEVDGVFCFSGYIEALRFFCSCL
jgi:hypothetical protein